MSTEILGIDEITAAQADQYLTHNTGLRQLEAQLIRVLDRDAGAVPGAPSSGDTYIVDTVSGAWAAATLNDIAHYYSSGWYFYTPIEGLRLWVNDENKLYIFDGSDWVEFAQGGIDLEDNSSPISAASFTKIVFTGDCTVGDNGDGSATVLVTGGTDGIYLDDNNSPVSSGLYTRLGFTGTGVTVTDNGGGHALIDVTPGVTVDDNSSPVSAAQFQKLRFIGGATVIDNGDGGCSISVPVPGQSGIYLEDGASPVSADLFTTVIFGGDCIVNDNGDGSATVVITGAEGSQGIYLDDNSSPVSAGLFTKLTFTGSCTVTDNGSGEGIVNVTGGGGSTGVYIEDNQSPIHASLFDTLIFTGTTDVIDNGDGSAVIDNNAICVQQQFTMTTTQTTFTTSAPVEIDLEIDFTPKFAHSYIDISYTIPTYFNIGGTGVFLYIYEDDVKMQIFGKTTTQGDNYPCSFNFSGSYGWWIQAASMVIPSETTNERNYKLKAGVYGAPTCYVNENYQRPQLKISEYIYET